MFREKAENVKNFSKIVIFHFLADSREKNSE